MSTLGKRVFEQILEKIQAGELKVGDSLPSEVNIATDLGVSRSTVRLAFAELEKGGVISRRRRAGTRIIADSPQPKYNMVTGGVHELLSLGRDTRLDIIEVSTVRTEDIAVLEGQTSETGFWLEVFGTRTMHGDALPFSVNRVYVPARYVGIEPLLNNQVTSVYQVIESAFSVSVARVSQTTKAIACSSEDAVLMGLAADSPALRIDAELYAENDELMEVSMATFNPDSFHIRTEVKIDTL
jgi:DNA-binding GntR family transcriptional regulator